MFEWLNRENEEKNDKEGERRKGRKRSCIDVSLRDAGQIGCQGFHLCGKSASRSSRKGVGINLAYGSDL